MITYSSPELIDAEVSYRRERIARDWQTTSTSDGPVPGALAQRARAAIFAVGHLRARRQRHA